MSAVDRVVDAVEQAQRILAAYVEPGDRDCAKTINELLDVLDDGELVKAVEEAKLERRPEKDWRAGPQQNLNVGRA